MKKRNPNRRFTRRRRSTFSAELIRCGDAAAASNRRRSLLFGAVFDTQKKKKQSTATRTSTWTLTWTSTSTGRRSPTLDRRGCITKQFQETGASIDAKRDAPCRQLRNSLLDAVKLDKKKYSIKTRQNSVKIGKIGKNRQKSVKHITTR